MSAENEGTDMFYVGFYQPRDSVRETATQMEEKHDIPVMVGSIEMLATCCELVFLDLENLSPTEGVSSTEELHKQNVKVIGLVSGEEEPLYLLSLVKAGLMSIMEEHSLQAIVEGVNNAQKNHSILPITLLQLLRNKIVEMSQVEEEAFAHRLLACGVNLTPKQIKIAFLMTKGLKNRDIAYLLDTKERTVKVHISHIYTKTGIKRRVNLIHYFKELKHKKKGACL
ncbi:LuxR C-terminal-related transcriptional regulator [Oceanobacillus manasiensis]|uniref:LuxR C-terminal-related transcriptional regulator n=1 Tax=Oceanobacillus manasiensis TaxID=586413 RepID=UPI0005A7CB40|nr:LuxR C-terminal-related transcriptional regulator [Oceanobacillus manasiensis]